MTFMMLQQLVAMQDRIVIICLNLLQYHSSSCSVNIRNFLSLFMGVKKALQLR